MVADRFGALSTKPSEFVLVEQPNEQVLQHRTDAEHPLRRFVPDALEELLTGLLLIVEGWHSHHHFVDDRAKAPPVRFETDFAAGEDLRREILRRSHHLEPLLRADISHRQTEVSKPYVAFPVDQHVLGFEAA